jgi:ligand-binding SRPBCC domain-containing protein
MGYHVQFEQWVPFPLARVFEFFSNPENLPRIMPESSDTRLTAVNRVPPPGFPANAKAAGVGTTIVTSFRTIPGLPFRSQWIARITEFESHHYFADVQDKGPFQRWHHRHEFHAETRESVDGTLIRDIVEYEVGIGPVGSLANLLFVRNQMLRTFEERQRKLPQLLAPA